MHGLRLDLPQGFRADRKSWAVLRRRVFRDPPTERNRVWQTDFSEFETTTGGIWRICAVIDYATKYCLAVTVTATGRGADALHCLQLAVAEAQHILELQDLRADRGVMDIVDAAETVIGHEGPKFAPMFATIFLYILVKRVLKDEITYFFSAVISQFWSHAEAYAKMAIFRLSLMIQS